MALFAHVCPLQSYTLTLPLGGEPKNRWPDAVSTRVFANATLFCAVAGLQGLGLFISDSSGWKIEYSIREGRKSISKLPRATE